MQLPEFVRVSFSPLVIVALVLSIPVTVVGLVQSVGDPEGTTPWGYLIYVVPSGVTIVGMFEVLWMRLPISRVTEMLRRILLVPAAAGLVSAIAVGVVCLVMGLPESAGPDHASLGEGNPHPMVQAGIAGAALAGAVGLGLGLVVVTPLIAMFYPDDFADFQYALLADEERPLAHLGVRLIAGVVMLVVPMALGIVMNWPWLLWPSLTLIVVGTIAIVRVQRRLGRSPV